jgi:hypothetical protein
LTTCISLGNTQSNHGRRAKIKINESLSTTLFVLMEPLLQSLQTSILPEDIAVLADGSIKALSVNEVLAITHAIDHQLSMMKRGVMGSDIVGFVAHLLSTGHLDPTTFPRSPTPLELQLCRKLARIEDSDIVTQLQILRMLDAFRTLVVLFQRNLMGVIDEELARGGQTRRNTIGKQPTSPRSNNNSNNNARGISEDVAARIDLASDVCASAAALTDDTLFASAYGGMIPTFVLYQLAERYGLDARSCFHPYSAMSMLPTTDDAVLALRDLKAKEEEQRRRIAVGNNKSSSSNGKTHQRSDDDDGDTEILKSSAGGAAAAAAVAVAAEQNRRKNSNVVLKNTVVPVEFISPVILTDTFTPLDKKLLRVFTDTFGAYDPNDPHNQFGLSSDLVDGHYLLILPLQKFAHVLRVSLVRASKVVQNALDGVVSAGGARGYGGASVGAVESASTRRRSQRQPNETLSTAGDDMEDLFGVWGSTDAIEPGGSVGLRSLSPVPGHLGKKMSFISEAVMSTRTPPPANNLATSQRGSDAHGAAEALPSPFHVVVQRGYLRFPEFELVIRYLNQDPSHSSDPAKSRKEAQQVLVDELVIRSSNAQQLTSTKGSSASAASPQQVELARQLSAAARRQRGVFAPSGQDEQMLIDAQASYIERILFNVDGSLRVALNTNHSNNINAVTGKKSGKGLRSTDITSPSNGDEGAAERKFPALVTSGGVQDANNISVGVPGGGGGIPAAGGNSVTGGSDVGGDRRHLTFSRSKKGSHHEHSHKQQSPSSPTPSSTSGAPLHGWAIHDHPADRLAVKPMNGKDVNRLRKSFVSSPERTTHSYTTNTEATIANASDAAKSGMSSNQGATSGSNALPLVINNTNASGTSTTQGSGSGAPVLQRRVVSPRQRQLMEVLNLEKMAEVMDRIPEDPMGLFTTTLLGGGGTGAASGQPGGTSNSGGGGGQVGQALLSPSGGITATHLSIAALLQATEGSVNGAYFGSGNGSVNTQQAGSMFTVEIDPSVTSKRTGGTRTSIKAAKGQQQHSGSEGGLLLSPTLLGTSRNQRLMSNSGNEEDLSISHNPYDVTVSAPDAVLANGGDSTGGCVGGTSGEPSGGVGSGNNLRSSSQHRSVPLRSTGIHPHGWRAVHYIPKLGNDSIGDYCDSVKRSGGGFGERGRLPPSAGEQQQPAGSDHEEQRSQTEKRKRHHRKAHHSNPTVPIETAEDQHQQEAVEKSRKQPRAPRPKREHASGEPRADEDEKEQQQQQPKETQRRRNERDQDEAAVPPRRLPATSSRSARDPDLLESGPRVPAPPQRRKVEQQPASARRPNEHHSPLAAPTVKSHNTTSSSKSARQPAVSAQSVAPPPRGFMAVMDSSRQSHGGTMLSFIPSALAIDVVRSINMSNAFPNSPGGPRHSARGSLLEPIGQGGRSTQILQDGREVAKDPLHEAVMARSREQMGKLRFTA